MGKDRRRGCHQVAETILMRGYHHTRVIGASASTKANEGQRDSAVILTLDDDQSLTLQVSDMLMVATFAISLQTKRDPTHQPVATTARPW